MKMLPTLIANLTLVCRHFEHICEGYNCYRTDNSYILNIINVLTLLDVLPQNVVKTRKKWHFEHSPHSPSSEISDHFLQFRQKIRQTDHEYPMFLLIHPVRRENGFCFGYLVFCINFLFPSSATLFVLRIPTSIQF